VIELLLQAERTLAAGRIDEAERLYRQAAAADPRSSIAVVGLARVTLERGDEPGAWRLARQALEIDPENVAAQRLAQRLEEIYAYRGESIAALAAAAGAPAESDAVVEPEREPVPEPEAEPAGAATPSPPPSQPDHRSLVDRLFRRSRP
jgi:tetratricopeptide (TPR) repeat protein